MNHRLLELEWAYLTDECKAVAAEYMAMGISDVEMAVELAIAALGDEKAFVIEERGIS